MSFYKDHRNNQIYGIRSQASSHTLGGWVWGILGCWCFYFLIWCGLHGCVPFENAIELTHLPCDDVWISGLFQKSKGFRPLRIEPTSLSEHSSTHPLGRTCEPTKTQVTCSQTRSAHHPLVIPDSLERLPALGFVLSLSCLLVKAGFFVLLDKIVEETMSQDICRTVLVLRSEKPIIGATRSRKGHRWLQQTVWSEHPVIYTSWPPAHRRRLRHWTINWILWILA